MVDHNSGDTGWGHIMVDDIIFSGEAAAPYNPETGINLLVNGKVVATATGQDSEQLDWASWNVKQYEGQQAQIQVVDDNTGGWGHVDVDDIMFAVVPALSQAERVHWVDYGADHYAAPPTTTPPAASESILLRSTTGTTARTSRLPPGAAPMPGRCRWRRTARSALSSSR